MLVQLFGEHLPQLSAKWRPWTRWSGIRPSTQAGISRSSSLARLWTLRFCTVRAPAGPDLDDEDRIEELAEFLYVARHSDSFGFDMLVWFPEDEHSEARVLAVEVKSSSGGHFFMSEVSGIRPRASQRRANRTRATQSWSTVGGKLERHRRRWISCMTQSRCWIKEPCLARWIHFA